jgi:hypothetical protein
MFLNVLGIVMEILFEIPRAIGNEQKDCIEKPAWLPSSRRQNTTFLKFSLFEL